MSYTVSSFFFKRRFLPLFLVQSAGAFNDNLLKQALGLFIIYSAESFQRGYVIEHGALLLILANVFFTLPFFLFSALAGQLADKFEKSTLIRFIKYFELAIMLLAALGFMFMQMELLLVTLCLMGLQSTLFGPIKYSILPDHLADDELVGGNALIEGGTFLSILLGTLIAGPLVQLETATALVSVLLIVVALLGVVASWSVPKAPVSAADLSLDLNIARSTWDIMKYAANIKPVFLSIVGISWFWVLGALFVTLFAPFAKDDLAANQEVVSGFLAMFSIGIAVGSLLCSRALHGDISARYVPLGAIGITLFTWDLSYYSWSVGPLGTPDHYLGFIEFLRTPGGLRIFLDLVLIAVSGGFFVVPLYAIMQSKSDDAHRARVVASNNVVNAFSIVTGSFFVLLLQYLGVGTVGIFAIFGAVNVIVTVLVCEITPQDCLRAILRTVAIYAFRLEVRGEEVLAELDGQGAIVVANHCSTIDALLLSLFLPNPGVLCVDKSAEGHWTTRLAGLFVETLVIDQKHPFSIKPLVQRLKNGDHCMLFPEGRVTVTGSLMKVYETPIFLSENSGAPIVPLRVDGTKFSHFSRLKGIVCRKWFPRVTLTILEPFHLLPGIERSVAARELYDAMAAAMVAGDVGPKTLFENLCFSAEIHGSSKIILEDHTRETLSYAATILRSLVLGRVFTRCFQHEYVVGVLLPNCNAAVLSVFGLSQAGFVPAMLNFSAGVKHVDASCTAAGVRHILSSRALCEDASVNELMGELEKKYTITFLEDLRSDITLWDRVFGLVARYFGRILTLFKKDMVSASDTAVILFTSGSEGLPKGVALSHEALVTNTRQVLARVDCSPADKVFNALPMFHSFGLSVGVFLPFFSGMKCFVYPSPLHYKIIAELVYETGSTMMFGTDTFLRGYARVAHPYDFFTVKYVFAGAEKVADATRTIWFERFGIRIYEGYGATETAPVLSLNTPMHFKNGSVGRLLPAIEYRIRDVEGIDEGGVLEVRGPNIMNGYYRIESPSQLQALDDGWYDTGDVVRIDEEGYIFIIGRVKRFAKIAGEMVSLTTVERILEQRISGCKSALVVRRHPSRGEELVLFTERFGLARAEVVDYVRQAGFSSAWAPRSIEYVEELPLLKTGKTDYVTLGEMANQTHSERSQVSAS
jgi:acyl-[acyl-carrier-protein]-phospholipid O-acyltransferase/long-chain-fatty-acid--[acyl-carrier-protein] ligase